MIGQREIYLEEEIEERRAAEARLQNQTAALGAAALLAAVRLKEVEEQRDALADAVKALLAGRDGLQVVAVIPVVFVPSEPGSSFGSDRQEVALTVSAERLRIALRAAGRLP